MSQYSSPTFGYSQSAVAVAMYFLFLLGISFAANDFQRQVLPGKESISISQINKLILDLAANDFKTREQATKELEQIGLPALNALQQAEETSDLETRTRAAGIVKTIRLANGLPTNVKGMEFKLTLDSKEWNIPQPNNETSIKLALEVTNTTDVTYRFNLFEATKVQLVNAKGRQLIEWGFRTTMATPRISKLDTAPLAKSQTFSLPFRTVLRLSKDGGVFFGCWDLHDIGGGVSGGIPKGRYRLAISYASTKKARDGGIPYWVGSAVTLDETVELK